MSEKYSDLSRWIEPIETGLNGRNVQLHRVVHHGELLERHMAHYEEIMKSADLVIVEGAPAAEHAFDPEIIRGIYDYSRSQGMAVSYEQIKEMVVNGSTPRFFAGLEKVAAKHNHPLIVIDPGPLDEGGLVNANDNISIAKYLAAAGGVATAFIPKIDDGIRKLGNELSGKVVVPAAEEVDKQVVSRRRMLQGALGLLGGMMILPLASEAEHDLRVQAHDLDNLGRNGTLGALKFDLNDFREVYLVRALDDLCRDELSRDKKIAVIYGAAHGSSILNYLQSPQEISWRLKAYESFIRQVRDPQIVSYAHNPETDAWDVQWKRPVDLKR